MAGQPQLRLRDMAVQPVGVRLVFLPNLTVQVKVGFHLGRLVKDRAGVKAVPGNPRHRFLIVGGIPQRRIGPLLRLRPHSDVMVGVVFALVVQGFLGQAPNQDVQGFLKHIPAILELDAVVFRFHRHNAPAHAQLQPPVAQVVQHTDFVEQAQGVVKGQQIDQGAEADVPGALGRRRQENSGRGSQAQRRYMMFRQMVAVETLPVGVLQQLQPLLVNPAVRLLFPLNPVKEAELQGFAVGRLGLRTHKPNSLNGWLGPAIRAGISKGGRPL